jgi:hypothetical protein
VSFAPESQLERIEKEAFARSNLTFIALPKSLQIIDGSVFVESHLENLLVEPGSAQFVARLGFLENTLNHHLIRCFDTSPDITIGPSITTIGANCFAGCDFLHTVTFALYPQIERLETNAFGFSALHSIIIPQTVLVIGSSCFYGCVSLSYLAFENYSRLERIEKQAFARSGLTDVVLPKSVQFIDGTAFADTRMTQVAIEVGSDRIVFRNNFLEDQMQKTLVRYFGECSFILIDQSTTIIGPGCFCGLESLGHLEFDLGSRLARFERTAFQSTGLKQIVIPNSVIVIGKWCFHGCQELKTVSFQTGSQLERLADWAFANCALERIVIPRTVKAIRRSCFAACTSLEEVVLESPSELESIDSRAFAVTSLRNIHLPKSLQQIGERCFLECHLLTEVLFEAGSHLQRIDECAFGSTAVGSIHLSLADPTRSIVNKSGCPIILSSLDA